MKRMQKVLAILLVVCLLLGMPMSIHVLAVGGPVTETDPVRVTLAHVVEAKPEWFRGATNAEEGKVLYPIFTSAWMNNKGSSYGVILAIVGGTNFCYATANGATMWGAAMGWDGTVGCYYIRLTGSLAVANLPTKLTDAQRAKYTSAVDTVSELQMLADDLGGRLVCHIFEKGTGITQNNGLVDSWYSNDGSLVSNLTVGSGGNKSGTASQNVYDCAQAPVTTYDNLFRMTGAKFIEEDGLLRINFNRSMQYGGSGNWRVEGRMCVVDANGYTVMYNATTDTYKNQYEVLSAGTEDGWSDVGFLMPLETVMPYTKVTDQYDYAMSAEQIANYRSLVEKAAALGSGYRVVYAVEEVLPLYARGEMLANYFVDGMWDANKLPLLANSCYRYTASNTVSTAKRVNDTAFAEVEYLLENPDVKPEDCGRVLSVTTDDIYSYMMTVTFDRPMNIDSAKEIYLTYEHSPSLDEEGFWQKSVSYYEYVTEGEGVTYTEVDGKKYSTRVRLQFGKLSGALPVGSGVRFCEYENNAGSEKNNGMIYAGYAHDVDGLGLYANTVGLGNHDLSWTVVGVSNVQAVAATDLGNNRIRLSFSAPVALSAIAAITADGNAVTAAVADNGSIADTGWVITTVAKANTVTLAEGAFTSAYGDAVTATTLTVDAITDNGEDFSSDFIENEEYSFMNADTGREIAVGGEVDFKLVKGNATNVWMLMTDDGKYVDLTGATATATTQPIAYLLVKAPHERYQIVLGNAALRDGDQGAANTAQLIPTLRDNNSISTGWYLTKKGDIKPLKILTFGASTTYGTNPDIKGPQLGWRDDLSADLVDKLERYVFVGSQVSTTTTLDQAELTRHEGNPGWTIKDIGNLNGLYDIVDGVRDKYDPDIVFFWCGGNDMVGYGGASGLTEDEMNIIMDNYADMLDKLTVNMTDDGNRTVFGTSGAPYTRSDMIGLDTRYRYKVMNLIEQKSWTMPVEFVDVYAAFNGDAENGLCSDKLHLSPIGDTYVANAYADMITKYYNFDGTKKVYDDVNDLQAALDAAQDGDTVTMTMNMDQSTEHSLQIPAGVTLDLNGKKLKVKKLLSFGKVVDKSDGYGQLIVSNDPSESFVCLQQNNTDLPLYDTAVGAYRFFRYQVVSRGMKPMDTAVKFGIAPMFTNDAALALLGDAANAGVTLTANLTLTMGEKTYPFIYPFSQDVLARYAAGEGDTITLTVKGIDTLEADAVISLAPTLTSKTDAAQTGKDIVWPEIIQGNDKLKNLFHGIYALTECDANGTATADGGYFVPQRFSPERIAEYIEYNQTAAIKAPYYNCTAGVRMDFYTDADTVSFDFLVRENHYDASSNHPSDKFDVYEDGVYKTSVTVKYGNDGTFSYTRRSANAESRITIVFPNRHYVILSNFSLGNTRAYDEYDMQILMLGASTDQGLFADKPSDSFLEIITRELNAELMNLAVGGMIYRVESLDDDLDFDPDLILVDLDGNTYYSGISENELEKRMTDYLTRVKEIYPLAQVTVITSVRNNKPASWTQRVIYTAEKCGASVIVGMENANQNNAYWNPDLVHPNSAGFAIIAENMLPRIREQLGLI